MRIFLIIPLLFLCSCSMLPVFEGDYVKFQGEVKDQLVDQKKKISSNADVINDIQGMDKDVVTVITSRHAEEVAQWANEDINFSKPKTGGNMMTILMSLLGVGGLGGLGAIKKIMNLTDTVRTVAVMDGSTGKEEAIKRGIKV